MVISIHNLHRQAPHLKSQFLSKIDSCALDSVLLGPEEDGHADCEEGKCRIMFGSSCNGSVQRCRYGRQTRIKASRLDFKH